MRSGPNAFERNCSWILVTFLLLAVAGISLGAIGLIWLARDAGLL